MQTTHLQVHDKTWRSASALVALVILIALVCIIYLVRLYLKEPYQDPDLVEDLTPWKEWRFRESSPKPPQEPSAEQPNITEGLEYDTNVRLAGTGDPRGSIEFIVGPEGTVGGRWYDYYYKKPKINFDIMNAGFSGKTFPAKLYRNESGEEPSKLYFMAKGEFLIQETDMVKSRVHHRAGDIYVRGWIDPDYATRGEITITSDEDYFETFVWEAAKPLTR
ncbi:MAG: hypothetical protein ACYS21_19095 [Planctomycetota bacterium]